MLSPDFLVKCINDPFEYNFLQNPDKVPDPGAARSQGLNCGSLLTLYADLNGYFLPHGALPYELFLNHTNIATISTLTDMCMGDVLWLSPEKRRLGDYNPHYDDNGYLTDWRDGPAQHILIYAGRKKCGEPVYVHASYKEKMTVAQTFGEFDTTRKAHQINRVGRLITPRLSEISAISAASHMSC